MKAKSKRAAAKPSKGGSTVETRVQKLVADDFLGGVGEVLSIEQTRALWTKTAGSVTTFHELFGKYCSSSCLLEVCGIAAVGGDGSVELKLSDFVCLAGPAAGRNYERFAPPAFVVATPRASAPVHLTSLVTVQTDDVSIKIFAWDPSGAPTSSGLFNWHCCVRLVEVIG